MIAVLENIERVLKSKRKDKHARYVALDIVRQEKRKLQSPKQPVRQAIKPIYLPAHIRQVVDSYLRQGRMILAIKEVRAAAGVGLKEAKDFVESLSTYRGQSNRATHTLIS